MKKFIFSIVIAMALVVSAGAYMLMVKANDRVAENDEKEETDSVELEEIDFETLSDKNFYFVPDAKLAGKPIVDDMADLTNGFAIFHNTYCDVELWFRLGLVVNEEIGRVRTDVFKDKNVAAEAGKYVNALKKVMPKDTAQWEMGDTALWAKVEKIRDSYGKYLSKRFALERYGKYSPEEFAQYLDFGQFVPDYNSVYELRKTQSKENERLLLSKAKQAENFDVECIYTIEYAHQQRHEGQNKAVPLLANLMKSGKYSRFLIEVWRTWRCLKQLETSPSRDGIIPNLEYNTMRNRCLNTILKQIVDHPTDVYAINLFGYMASCDNICRFNDFMFGNSAGMEQMELFPEIFEEEEEE